MSLTDEQIDGFEHMAYVKTVKRGKSRHEHSRVLARAIESAATAPLLERIAELERELEAVRKDAGWRPIETAPKDGTLFLCWVSAVRYGETDEGQPYQQDVSQADFCNWCTQADIPDCGWFDPCCGQIGDSQAVTHWMPLPLPPDAAKEQG